MPWATNVYWMYAVVVEKEFGLSRDGLMAALRENGVDTRSFFLPVHEQPVFAGDGGRGVSDFPVSTELSRKGLYLPSGLALTKTQIEAVCRAVKAARPKPAA